jgi:hypothetical protein
MSSEVMKLNHSGGGVIKMIKGYQNDKKKNHMWTNSVCSGRYDTTQFMSAMPNWSRELFALRPKGCLIYRVAYIRGDPAGKWSILGGDGIGHCEKNSSYEYVSNSD